MFCTDWPTKLRLVSVLVCRCWATLLYIPAYSNNHIQCHVLHDFMSRGVILQRGGLKHPLKEYECALGHICSLANPRDKPTKNMKDFAQL